MSVDLPAAWQGWAMHRSHRPQLCMATPAHLIHMPLALPPPLPAARTPLTAAMP
jgi:hypothetical protein